MQVVIVVCGLIHRIVDLRIWNLNPADNLVVYCLKAGPVNNWGLVFFLGNCCVCSKLFVDDVLLVSGSPLENLLYTLMPPIRPTTAPMA